MASPPKFPRPQKPPVLPPRPDFWPDPTIAMQFERFIGRAVVGWSKLEACMEDFIWRLLDVPIEQGRIVTLRTDSVGKIRMLRQLGELILAEAQFHRLSPTLDEIDVLREDRNSIIHGTWGRSGPGGVHICLSLRPKGLAPDQVVAESFPEARIRSIIDATDRTKWVLIDLMNELPASPNRPPQQRPGGL
jgi:hypothetical protein